MPHYHFLQVDVFTDVSFGGNPLAVFPDAEGLTSQQMQQLALELNLSETTFVLPPSDPARVTVVSSGCAAAEQAISPAPRRSVLRLIMVISC